MTVIVEPRVLGIETIAQVVTQGFSGFELVKGKNPQIVVIFDEDNSWFEVQARTEDVFVVIAEDLNEEAAYDIQDYLNYAIEDKKVLAALTLVSDEELQSIEETIYEFQDYSGFKQFEYIMDNYTYLESDFEFAKWLYNDDSEADLWETFCKMLKTPFESMPGAFNFAHHLTKTHENSYRTDYGVIILN